MGSTHASYRHLAIDEPGPGIVRCVMSNPPAHTLVASELAEIEDFVAAMRRREDVRVVVFTGGGEGVFIRHYEVGELAESSERAAAARRDGPAPAPAAPEEARLHRFNRVTLDMQSAAFVTVAAMNGNAAGGGLEFALGCDFRLLADGDYLIGLPETGVGIIPGAGGTQRLTRLLGTAKALELILHGRRLSPREALELALVTEVVPEGDFELRVLEFAANLASRSPIGIASAKEAIYRGMDGSLERGLLLEQALFRRCMESEDAARAMRAALDGESWEWRGR